MPAAVRRNIFDDALKVVRRIGPAGHYLGDAFTLEHFRSAFAMLDVMNFSSFEQWSAAGSHDMAQLCRAKARSLLDAFEAPLIEASVREKLDAFVLRRINEIDPTFS